jgi:hypothetical protein
VGGKRDKAPFWELCTRCERKDTRMYVRSVLADGWSEWVDRDEGSELYKLKEAYVAVPFIGIRR